MELDKYEVKSISVLVMLGLLVVGSILGISSNVQSVLITVLLVTLGIKEVGTVKEKRENNL